MKTTVNNPFNHQKTQEIYEALKMKSPKIGDKDQNFIRSISSPRDPYSPDEGVKGNVFVSYDIRVEGNIFQDMTKSKLNEKYTRDNYKGLGREFLKLVEQTELHKKIVTTGATLNKEAFLQRIKPSNIYMHQIMYVISRQGLPRTEK